MPKTQYHKSTRVKTALKLSQKCWKNNQKGGLFIILHGDSLPGPKNIAESLLLLWLQGKLFLLYFCTLKQLLNLYSKHPSNLKTTFSSKTMLF